MREITITIVQSDDDLKVIATEKVNGEEATYQLHNFNIAFIAHIGQLPYPDASRDRRNQYHFRRDWEMLPELTVTPLVATPTLRGSSGRVLCALEKPE